MYSENSQALLLGARRAFFRVSSVAVLLACMIQPSFADFTTTDSNNLSSINTKLSSVYSRLGDLLNAFTSSPMAINIGSIVNNTKVLAQKLDTLISKIDSLSGSSSYNPTFSEIIYNPADYGIYLWVNTPTTNYRYPPSDGYYSTDTVQVTGFTFTTADLALPIPNLPVLLADTYYTVQFSIMGSGHVTGFRAALNSDIYNYSEYTARGMTTFTFDVSFPQSTSPDYLAILGEFDLQGYVQLSVYPSDSAQFNLAVNPDQGQVNDSIGSAVSDLDDFDNQIFADFDKYKSDLDFGLSAWGEAAAGISYIGNIFMIIWDNSPNQVIVLSLMLGLCCLVLGRGAKLARAARRSDRGGADDG